MKKKQKTFLPPRLQVSKEGKLFFLKPNLFLAVLGVLVSWWFNWGCAQAADSSYRVEAPLTVQEKGLVEVPLLPGLHYPSAKGLDLRVLGPEGQTRPFELYWKEEKSEKVERLKENTVQFLENGSFRWQGSLENPLKVRKIQAYLSAGDYVGKVNVFGLRGTDWRPLAHDAALYQVNGKSWAEILIPEGTYKTFRLEFISFDQKYKRKLVPLESVEATSEMNGKAFSEEPLSLSPQRADGKDEIQLSASLPGSGLYIKELHLTTSEPFVGAWTLGREIIEGGKTVFVVWREGRVESLGKGSSVLKLEPNDVLNGKALLLKLRPQNYLGKVENLNVILRLPRLVFKADQAGDFHVRAGCGEAAGILENPSAENRGNFQAAVWGNVQDNTDWKPESLVEKYHLGGGPFEGKGYAWQAPLSLLGPGYYRVFLNKRASLGGNFEGIRVVREGRQVPSFQAGGRMEEIPLTLLEEYDKTKNKSTWPFELPEASTLWRSLSLKAEGIFSRTLVLEKQTPGSLVWERVAQRDWNSGENKETEMGISLGGSALEGVIKMRLTMEHGDNRPLSLKKAGLSYYAPAFCFLADSSEGYQLMGGNPTAPAPRYDLSLVQNDLLTQEPQNISMGDCGPFSGQGMKGKLFRAFDGTNGALYGILGLVTLAMVLLIARLFPAIKNEK